MSTNSRFAVAVHVLSLMAWSDEEPLKSEQVAESVNTNPVVIRRMLRELADAGLVVSQTGSLGGSRLANDPAKTTLLDVYQALECGGVFSMHRQPPSRDCPVGVNIETVLGDVFLEVDSAVEQVLGNITINDVVQRLQPCGPATTHIELARNGHNGRNGTRKAAARNGNGANSRNGRRKHYDQRQIALSEVRTGAKSRRAKAFRPA
ncbi:MAG TPA: Rrf2 family transcriptional regulator [Pyrinomonadaceae bacterium]|nr:Rrf2 family transcriptional regulator [Pyrinomonadaceae bacterium]